jgi:hypothetical protein
MNSVLKLAGSGFATLMSMHCSACKLEGRPNPPWFGVERGTATLLGARAVDRAFQAQVWRAAKAHYRTDTGRYHVGISRVQVRRLSFQRSRGLT